MGHSVGRWEGETLVVEVTELIDQTWLDRSGNFHSGALTVTERYTPVTPYHIEYEATITDAEVFTEPWDDQAAAVSPEGGRRIPISTGPGTEAVWSRDGRELFYRNGDQMWVVEVETGTDFIAGSPDLLFEAQSRGQRESQL